MHVRYVHVWTRPLWETDPTWEAIADRYELHTDPSAKAAFAQELGLRHVRELYNIAARIPTSIIYRRTEGRPTVVESVPADAREPILIGGSRTRG